MTRTISFKKIAEVIECYKRSPRGDIGSAMTKFPGHTSTSHVDLFALQFLWAVGLDYGRGTRHSVGVYLNIHEQGDEKMGLMMVDWRRAGS